MGSSGGKRPEKGKNVEGGSVTRIESAITELRTAEKDLEERRGQQQIILDSVPAWIFYKDEGNHFIRVNKAFCNVMKMTKEQLEGKSLFDFYPKKQAEAFWKDDKAVIASGKPKRNIIEPMESPNGTAWLQTDKIPYKNEKGEIIGIIGFSQVITERKKAEDALKAANEKLNATNEELRATNEEMEATNEELKATTENLRESEEKNRTIVENVNDAILTYDSAGRILDVNENACRMLGYPRKELVGSTLESINSKANRPHVRKRLSELFKKGKMLWETVDVKKGGIPLPVYVSAKVISSKGAGIAQSFVRDITGLKKAEEELRESEERYRSLFDTANLMIQSVGPDGKYKYVNNEWKRALGYTEKDFARLTFLDVLRKDQHKHCLEIFAKVGKGKRISGIETVFVAKGGREIFVRGNIRPVMKDSQFISTAGFFMDVTEKKKAEEQLTATNEKLNATNEELRATNEEMEATNEELRATTEELRAAHAKLQRAGGELKKHAATLESEVDKRTFELKGAKERAEVLSGVKDEFIRNISHELKTPLTVILGNLSMLKDLAPIGREKEWAEMLTMLERNGMRLRSSIEQILELSNLSTTSARSERVYIDALVKDVYNEHAPLAEMKGLKLRLESAPAVVMGDPALLKLAVSNLVSNAVKFTRRGTVTLAVNPLPQKVEISISDTGPGMSRETKGRLFEKFFKADPNAPGTGIGLTLAKGVIDKHNGAISIRSEPGKGSTFTIALPRGVKA